MVARRAAKKNSVRIDLSDVETRVNVSEGEHRVAVSELSLAKGDKDDYIAWIFEVAEGDDDAGGKLYNNTSLAPQALWNLRTLLEALGQDIPDKAYDLDFEELVGLELMVLVENETYNGKKRPRIADFWAAEDEEEAKPKKGRRGKKADDDEPEEEEAKPARRSRRGAKADDEEEAPKAKRGSKKSKPEAAELTEDDINDMSEDELRDVIEEHQLDLDLDDFKTLRKMKAAVVDAAQEADILTSDEEPEEEEAKPARRSRSRR